MATDYQTIERPYNNQMERSEGGVVAGGEGVSSGSTSQSNTGSGGINNQPPVVEGQALNDLWIESWIKSRNYQPKSQGFYIDGKTGYIECMKLFAGSGGIVGGSLDIPDTTTANSFHVDASGNMWIGSNVADTYTAADAYILNDGSGKLSNVEITGSSNISLGTGSSILKSNSTDGLWLGAATFAAAPFRVSLAGAVTATSADITGTVTATAGQIANWTISTSALSTGAFDTISTMYFGSSGLSLSNTFKVTSGGLLTATGATITGGITATSGAIGGWTINATSFTSADGTVGLSSAVTGGDDIRFWAGDVVPASAEFKVTEAGALTATDATITGTITATAGTIGGFTIDSIEGIYAGTGDTRVQMKAGSGFWCGETAIGDAEFSVTNAGVLKAVSGTIGGCTLGTTSIGSTSFASGPLGTGWNISNTGTAEFQNVTVRGIIRTSVFEKDTISAVNGIVLISKADVLEADMTALDASTLEITGETTFDYTNNEVIRIKDGTDDEWLLVTANPSSNTYTVTRDLAESYAADTNPIWKKGTAVVSMGVGAGTKTGFILLDSSSAYSPYIDIYKRISNTFNDYGQAITHMPNVRLGWLQGIIDADVGLATTDVWGLYTDNAYIKGVIVANTGYIGGTTGWTIASGSISSVNAGNTTTMASGGTNAYIAGTTGSPEFKVTHAGVLTASGAVISGNITATTGLIGAFTINTHLYTGSKTAYNDTNAGVHVGSDGIGIGNNIFTVSSAGALVSTSGTFTNATVTGIINATAGKFGTATNYWSVGATGLTGVSASTDVVIKFNKTDFGQDTTDGFIMGYDYSASKTKFEWGDSDTSLLKYDGTNFTLTGGIISGSIINCTDQKLNFYNDAIKRSTIYTDTYDIRFYIYDDDVVSQQSFYIERPGTNTTDSYSESNQNSTLQMLPGGITAIGQSFTGSANKLYQCKFYLKKTGSPTGDATAKLYAHSGTFGVDGVPTGSALATSSTFDVSTLTTSYALVTLSFTEVNQFKMIDGNNYFIVLEYSTDSGSVDVGLDTSSPTADGNDAEYSGSWSYNAARDFCFYVYDIENPSIYSSLDSDLGKTGSPWNTGYIKNLRLSASTATTIVPLNIAPGVNPTVPINGDIWYDGSNLKIRIGSTTYTLDKTAV